MGLKKPWRDYSKKKFDVKEWREGDAIERGRMYSDLHRNPIIEGKTRDDVLKVLGEPDKKATVEGTEVWLYQVEVVGEKPLKYCPVSFNKKGGAWQGMAKGDTAYLLVTDDEL